MKTAVGNSRTDKKWKNRDISWDEFLARVSMPVRTTETVEEYSKLKKGQQDAIKDVGGFVGGHLREGRRKNGNVLCRSMLTLDMDYGKPGVWDQITLLESWRCCVYSTHKHTPESPRLRLIIPLAREVSEDEYPALGRMVAREIGIDLFDDTTYEPSRLMYWPSTPANGEFVFEQQDGELLNPDEYLGTYADWRDASTWPTSSRQSEAVHKLAAQQADPLAKEGVVGAFCRAYTVEEAIEAFLSDVYAPSVMNGRYDYIPADSSAGVVTYEGKFAFSHHATDPACGKLLNAFDLVRTHKYADLDDKMSFKAMCGFAVKDGRVNALLLEERREQAGRDFTENEDWTKGLQRDKSGLLTNSLHNITLILQHDPALLGIVFNEFSDGMEIKGIAPWKRPAHFPYWREADDAQLVSYIDSHYGSFSVRNYQVAVAKVTDDRSYHPVRAFLDALPEWDGQARVDTLLIDFFGAADNPYVRAVTRKTFVGAVARIKKPGCKFDTMLVLNGFQGQKKSSLLRRLCGEWFNDDVSLSQTKDKTAAEKLQGSWVIELSEMTGMKKADIETLKAFISRQNDIYRASYGKRASPHLRQCIFIGTTNADNGFLRDTTGNRRYWPVKTLRKYDGDPASIPDDFVQQFWAEAIYHYEHGEKLYLSDENVERFARLEQQDAMEADEREGIVRDYLDTMLPENWSCMDLFERRNFLNGSEFGIISLKGTVIRTRVSNMEIWCECFGRDRGQIRKSDVSEINAIMARIDGWSKSDTKMKFPLYGVVRGYERIEEA
jgi:predicted P-loop ATPase